MKASEFYDVLDKKLTSIEVGTRVSRFYSDDDNLVVVSLCRSSIMKERIIKLLADYDWRLYDIGSNDDNLMFTFKKHRYDLDSNGTALHDFKRH